MRVRLFFVALAAALVATTQPVYADDVVRVPDPDSTLGYDTPGMSYPAGSLIFTGPLPQLPVVNIERPGNSDGPSDDAAGCSPSHEKCLIATQCRSIADDKTAFKLYTCVNLIHIQNENDREHDYYAQEHIGWASSGTNPLVRFKLRAYAENKPYRVVRATPPSDYSVGSCGTLSVGAEYYATFSYSFEVCDGKIHPYVDYNIFHVSWISEGDLGDSSSRRHYVEGNGIWQVPEGQVPYDLDLRWEIIVAQRQQ